MPSSGLNAKTPPVSDDGDRTRIPRAVLRVAALVALAFSAATAAEYFIPQATYCPPSGGCADVRHWAYAQQIGGLPLGRLLPLVGMLGFTALFAGSLVRERTTMRVTAMLAIAGALAAAALLYLQASAIGAWCWLCVGVDSAAIVAGLAGAGVLATAGNVEAPDPSLRSPWWAAWVVVSFAPIAWAFTLPDPSIPPVIRELYRDGAINVVEVADFECPYCRAMHPVLKSVLDDAGGDVNLVRVIVPLAFHVHARDAARGYYCAVRMDHGEPMADALFAARDVSRSGTIAIASELGLDRAAFEECLDDPAIEARIREDERIARESQNQGLPTVYIGERVMIGFEASKGAEPYREAVEAARAGEGARVRWWPLATVALVAILAGVLGRRRKDA